jgi:hypothetical protein
VSVKVVFSTDGGKVWRVPYRLARWSCHVSYWFHLLGEWLDGVADRG